MKTTLFTLLLISSAGALAQAPSTPKLSASTNVAVKSLQQRAQQLQQAVNEFQQDLTGVDADVRREAPGFHINTQTLAVERETVITTPTPELKQPPPPKEAPKK